MLEVCSLRIRKVIQPELGTHRCSSARPAAKSASRTERGNGTSTIPQYGHARFLRFRSGILFRRSDAGEQIRLAT